MGAAGALSVLIFGPWSPREGAAVGALLDFWKPVFSYVLLYVFRWPTRDTRIVFLFVFFEFPGLAIIICHFCCFLNVFLLFPGLAGICKFRIVFFCLFLFGPVLRGKKGNT